MRFSAITTLRQRRWANLCVINLRIAIGFGVLPAGLKKLLGQPFTDAHKTGAFHEFLHAFYALDGLYGLVGAVQLVGAFLLMTQRYAGLGAALLFPVLVAINALCWSSAGIPTIVVVNFMTAGTFGLLVWDWQKWAVLVRNERYETIVAIQPPANVVCWPLWQGCGFAIFVGYLIACLVEGGVYRPRGMDWQEPSFYVLPALALVPVATWLWDRRYFKKHQRVG